MTDHEKRIREALEAATKNGWQTHVIANDNLRALLADLDAMRVALEKLTFAVDLAEDGCTNGGFGPGYENGLGIECGSVLESARKAARAALKGAEA